MHLRRRLRLLVSAPSSIVGAAARQRVEQLAASLLVLLACQLVWAAVSPEGATRAWLLGGALGTLASWALTRSSVAIWMTVLAPAGLLALSLPTLAWAPSPDAASTAGLWLVGAMITSAVGNSWQRLLGGGTVGAGLVLAALTINPMVGGPLAIRVASLLLGLLVIVAVTVRTRDRVLVRLEADAAELGQLGENLATERAFFEDVLRSMSDGVVVIDEEEQVVVVNPSFLELTGRDLDCQGRPGQELLPVNVLDGTVRDRDRVELPLAVGGSIPVSMRGRPLRNGRGAVFVARDLRETLSLLQKAVEAEEERKRATQLAEAYARLEDTHKELRHTQSQLVHAGKLAAVGQLAAAVAHELRSPLTAVLMAASLLEEQVTDTSQQRLLGHITSAGERCRNIVQGLLDFGRQSGQGFQRVDLAACGRAAVGLSRRLLEDRGAQLELELDEEVHVRGDAVQLQQVVLNLLLNAADSLDPDVEGNVVRLSATRQGDRAQLTVGDTGHGIEDEHLEHIFEPFFTTRPEGQGHGLGLSIAWGLVAAHEGEIRVSSSPDEGTSFTVDLPIATRTAG